MQATTEDSRRVLELLSQAKITVDEAEQLLRALRGDEPASAESARGSSSSTTASPQWIRITVEKQREGQPPKTVTIRTPVSVARGGVKLGAMFERFASHPFADRLRQEDVDVDFSKLDLSELDALHRRHERDGHGRGRRPHQDPHPVRVAARPRLSGNLRVGDGRLVR